MNIRNIQQPEFSAASQNQVLAFWVSKNTHDCCLNYFVIIMLSAIIFCRKEEPTFRNIPSLAQKRKHKLPGKIKLRLFKAAKMLFSICEPNLYLMVISTAGRVRRAEPELKAHTKNHPLPALIPCHRKCFLSPHQHGNSYC